MRPSGLYPPSMAILRIDKVGEVAARTQTWLESEVDKQDEADQITSVGHVLVIVELRSRAEDKSAADGRSVRAHIASYCDDSREWVQRALLSEASELHEASAIQIFTEDEDEDDA